MFKLINPLFIKKKTITFFLLLLCWQNQFSQTAFITTWQTTSASETITIPRTGGGFSYNVNWGDGTTDPITYTANATHIYTAAGIYTVTITGTFRRVHFNNSGDKDKILSIEQWGSGRNWSNLSNAFYGCSNLVNNATDVPDLSSGPRLTGMFRDATSIGTGSATNWNSWNTSLVDRMNNMFYGATSFNENLNSWNTSNADRMNNMFRGASSFNGDISSWDVTSVTNMSSMFRNATSFNSNISSWLASPSVVTNMAAMFRGATNFNSDVSGWNVSTVTNMGAMYRDASSFDQNIGSWDVSSVTNFSNMFNGAELSPSNYNALLIGWNSLTLQPGEAFHGGNSQYCSPAAVVAKANIIATNGWSFNDGGAITSFTWNGTTDTDWSDATNWQDECGTTDSTIDVTIPSVTNLPNINSSTDISVNNLTINSGATLTIDGSITLNSNLVTNNGLIINSGGSIIVSGTSSGNLTYNSNIVNANEYYNFSPSVNDETIEDFISNNDLQTGGGNVGFYSYDNSTASGYAGTGYVFYQPSSTGSFVQGRGYAVQLANTGDFNLVGTMPTSDVSILVSTGTIDDSNLIGNPFPSYLPANTNAAATNNLLTQNSGVLSEETLWFWDNTINDYVAINNGSPARFVAPAQGFFVDASGSGNFNFLESWQSHQTTDVYNKAIDTVFRIDLSVKNALNQVKKTQVFYYNNKTINFDNGYDSSSFSDGSESLSLNTRLVGDNNSQDLTIQTLPRENIGDYIIPLSVKGSGNLTFSAVFETKPYDVSVYLEDRVLNKSTLLISESEYAVNVGESIEGIGRFYLSYSNKVLTVDEEFKNNVHIFISRNKELNINNLNQEKIIFSLFDVLGKELMKEKFSMNSSNLKIPLSDFKNGIYIVNVKAEKGFISKKIILN